MVIVKNKVTEDSDIMMNRELFNRGQMKKGQRLIARLNAQKLRLAGEDLVIEAKEMEVFAASIEGDRLRVSDSTGILAPTEFILTEEGIWQSDHGWYIRQELPTIVWQGGKTLTSVTG